MFIKLNPPGLWRNDRSVMVIKAEWIWEIGQRTENQDYIYPPPGKVTTSDRVFVVCDGVGGAAGGGVASKIASMTIGDSLTSLNNIDQTAIERVINEATESIQTAELEDRSLKGMSTTFACVVIEAGKSWISWAGDSKIGLVRNKKWLFISSPHSLYSKLINEHPELADLGKMEHGNMITSFLSSNPETCSPVIVDVELLPGDRLFIYSDGINEVLDDDSILAISNKSRSLKKVKSRIFNTVSQVAKDNFSMYLLEFD